MNRGTKSELQMLRELAWAVLPKLHCCFCGQPIIEGDQRAMTFGHRRHPPIMTKITMHHEDKNRENNSIMGINHGQFIGNIKISHKKCHIAHHANERRTNEPSDSTDDIPF